jgi:hypothetical protein
MKMLNETAGFNVSSVHRGNMQLTIGTASFTMGDNRMDARRTAVGPYDELGRQPAFAGLCGR